MVTFYNYHHIYSAWKKEYDPPNHVELELMSILLRAMDITNNAFSDNITTD